VKVRLVGNSPALERWFSLLIGEVEGLELSRSPDLPSATITRTFGEMLVIPDWP
jgi:hypothetical protein